MNYKFSLKGHKGYISGIAWRPIINDQSNTLFVSSSKDNTLKLWNVKYRKCINTGARHSKGITKIMWSGEDFIYSAS